MEEHDVPRPEYPRPQMLRKNWLNLNGQWEFESDDDCTGEARSLASGGEMSRSITVPFCPESKLSGIGNPDFMQCVWYRRSFEVPATWRGHRILLHFGAVDYAATVWVNGKLAGSHRGGYTPFSFDVTALLGRGENIVVVRAVDDTPDPLQPTGKQSTEPESHGCVYTRTTGIWQTVWLEPVGGRAYVKNVRFYPQVESGSVTIQVSLGGRPEGLVLNAAVFAHKRQVGSAAVEAHGEVMFTVELSDVFPWEPGSPFLYEVDFSLDGEVKNVDKVSSYFGLREIHLDGQRVLINGKPIFQRLVLDQGFYPDGIYTAPSDEALRHDIECSMRMGFNGARLHQKVFEPRFLYWADTLGYLCWGEYPNWGISHTNPEDLETVLGEWLEAVQRDFNHPSVVGWCPFNETPAEQNPELLRLIYRATKAIDPTRPVIDSSGYTHVETDIYDCHNYEQDPARFAECFEPFRTTDAAWRNRPQIDASYAGQPYFVSEYGGIWWNPGQPGDKAWGYGERPASEAEFLARYRGLTETLLNHPKMFGFCYTQLYDIEQEVNGLYTYDRQPKFDPETIRAINTRKAATEE